MTKSKKLTILSIVGFTLLIIYSISFLTPLLWVFNCSDIIEDDIYEAIDLKTCVEDRNITGGPAKEAVMASIKKGEEFLGLL